MLPLTAVLKFQGETKGLVLNKTNASMIAHDYGREIDDWVGKTIECYKDAVPYQGRIVDAIRVRVPQTSDADVVVLTVPP